MEEEGEEMRRRDEEMGWMEGEKREKRKKR